MRRTRFHLAVLVWLVAACGAIPSDAGAPRQATYRHLNVSAAAQTIRVPSRVGLVVSAVQVDSSSYLLADYQDVYRLTRAGNSYVIAALARPAVSAWYPTGLAYRDGTLYVANYLGHDVLELRLSGAQLVLVRRITNPQMIGPENLALGANGTIVVADYDGNAVLQFAADGSLRWRVPMGRAHGVTESGGAIYASSLLDRTITKLDQAGGTLAVAASEGSSPGRYLWPVGLADAGDRIVVTDTHNGRITVLDHGLRVLGYTGVNGPGVDAFNFPYATLPIAGGYLIVDTFKQRLIRTDLRWIVQAQILLGSIEPRGHGGPVLSATDDQPYAYPSLPGVDVAAALGLRPATRFVGGYGGVVHVDRSGTVDKLDLSGVELGSPYVTWVVRVGAYLVAGSPENRDLGVIDPATGLVAQVEVGYDTWWLPDGFLLSERQRGLAQIIRPAVVRIAGAKRLLAGGASRRDAFAAALDGGQPGDSFADLTSPAARTFLRSGMGPADARVFFATALRESDPRVVELAEVKFLSGT